MYGIYALSLFNNHGVQSMDSEFTALIPALSKQAGIEPLINDNLSCTSLQMGRAILQNFMYFAFYSYKNVCILTWKIRVHRSYPQ
jgi:hypothetical protein